MCIVYFLVYLISLPVTLKVVFPVFVNKKCFLKQKAEVLYLKVIFYLP